MADVLKIADEASAQLARLAEPSKAAPMAAYMKTKMPFYGVQAKPRHELAKQLVRAHPISDAADYEALVLALWGRPHREEKYLAIAMARGHKRFIGFEQLGLYERLIREGAWWDFVDEIAAHLVGPVVRGWPEQAWPVMDDWIVDDDLWIRRSALLCQLGAKAKTSQQRLFEYCLMRAEDSDFFIRKAIGWALREHARVDADAVSAFVDKHKAQLSGLSYREATKHLKER